MFCNKCGNQIQDDDKFCPYCGNMNALAKPDNTQTDPFGYPIGQPQYKQTPQQQQQKPQQQSSFSQQGPSTSSNTYALVGFILSFFIAILGLIFSIMGLQEANKHNGDRKGFAIAGIIISCASMVITLFYMIFSYSLLFSLLPYFSLLA